MLVAIAGEFFPTIPGLIASELMRIETALQARDPSQRILMISAKSSADLIRQLAQEGGEPPSLFILHTRMARTNGDAASARETIELAHRLYGLGYRAPVFVMSLEPPTDQEAALLAVLDIRYVEPRGLATALAHTLRAR